MKDTVFSFCCIFSTRQVDLFAPLGTSRVVLRPKTDRYTVSFGEGQKLGSPRQIITEAIWIEPFKRYEGNMALDTNNLHQPIMYIHVLYVSLVSFGELEVSDLLTLRPSEDELGSAGA